MTRRLISRLALCAGALVLTAAPATAQQSPPAEQRSSAAARLAQCLQTHERLSVLLLVDQSGSLDATDPNNLRVGGLGAALLNLQRLARQLGPRKTVEILIAGFYYRVDTYPAGQRPPRWSAVNDETIGGLLDEVRRFATPERHKGHDTDYAAAMLTSRDLFRARTKELDASGAAAPCKALVWFTDGNYEIQDDPGPRPSPHPPYAPDITLGPKDSGDAVERRGVGVLCDDRGAMDDLVRDDVVKFTVGLSTPRKRFDTTLLQDLTDGSNGCGRLVGPDTGQFVSASRGEDLLFVFPDGGGSTPPVDPPLPDCPGSPCERGTKEFRLVDGLGRFILTAYTGRPGIEIVLVAPSGREVRLRPGDPDGLQHSGVRITQRWLSDRQVVVDGALAPGDKAWQGTWGYAFVRAPNAPEGSISQTLELTADIVPELVGAPQLTRGEPTTVTFRLRRRARGSAPSPLLGEAQVTTTVTDGERRTSSPEEASGPEGDVYAARVTAPDASASTADFEVHVAFAEGSHIAPIFQPFPIGVKPPKNYPLVSPDRLELPSISGNETTSGLVTITGSKTSPGCAWIGPPETDAPKDAGEVAFSVEPAATTAGTCVPVNPGETKSLRVTFHPGNAATGSVQSNVPVHLSAKAVPGKHVTTSVPAEFELYPTGVIETIGRTVALMVLGVLLPLLILHLLNFFSARFAPEHRVKYAAESVTYTPGKSFAAASGGPPATEYGDFEWLKAETGSRKRVLDVDVLKLHTVASGSWPDRSFRLFRGPYGVATADGSRITAGSSTALKELRRGFAHEVPLGLAGTWIFVVGEIDYGEDPAASSSPRVKSVQGRLVLLIPADAAGNIDQGKDLEREARTALASYPWPPPEEQHDDPKPPSRLDGLRERMPGRGRDDGAEEPWPAHDNRPATPAADDDFGAPPAPVSNEPDGPAGLRF